MKSIKLKISGLHCPGCVTGIKEALLSTQGISKAEIDIINDTATVEYFEHKVTVDKLISIVENIGFEAKPLLN